MADIYNFEDGEKQTNADEYLEQQKGIFDNLMVIGFDKDGDICSGVYGLTMPEIVYLLEYIKKDMLEDG